MLPKYLLFGECLVEQGVITRCQLEEALRKQQAGGGTPRLGRVLRRLGYITKSHVSKGLAHQFGLPVVELSALEIPESIYRLINAETAQMYRVVPVAEQDEKVILATANPMRIEAVDNVGRLIERPVETVVATQSEISCALSKYYGIAEIFEHMGCFVSADPDGL